MAEETDPKIVVRIVEGQNRATVEHELNNLIVIYEKKGYKAILNTLTAVSTQTNIPYRFVLIFSIPEAPDSFLDGPPE